MSLSFGLRVAFFGNNLLLNSATGLKVEEAVVVNSVKCFDLCVTVLLLLSKNAFSEVAFYEI